MASTDDVVEKFARNLHRAHERRTAMVVVSTWEALEDRYQEEYLGVARSIHAALYMADQDVESATGHLIEHYGHGDHPRAPMYWTARIREAIGGV